MLRDFHVDKIISHFSKTTIMIRNMLPVASSKHDDLSRSPVTTTQLTRMYVTVNVTAKLSSATVLCSEKLGIMISTCESRFSKLG